MYYIYFINTYFIPNIWWQIIIPCILGFVPVLFFIWTNSLTLFVTSLTYMLTHLWHVDIFPEQSDASCLCLLGCMDFEEPSQISSTFLASGPEQIAGGQYPSNFGGRMLGKWSPKGAKLEPIEVPSPTSVVRWGCLKLSSCNSTQFNHHGRCQVSFIKHCWFWSYCLIFL